MICICPVRSLFILFLIINYEFWSIRQEGADWCEWRDTHLNNIANGNAQEDDNIVNGENECEDGILQCFVVGWFGGVWCWMIYFGMAGCMAIADHTICVCIAHRHCIIYFIFFRVVWLSLASYYLFTQWISSLFHFFSVCLSVQLLVGFFLRSRALVCVCVYHWKISISFAMISKLALDGHLRREQPTAVCVCFPSSTRFSFFTFWFGYLRVSYTSFALPQNTIIFLFAALLLLIFMLLCGDDEGKGEKFHLSVYKSDNNGTYWPLCTRRSLRVNFRLPLLPLCCWT